MKRLNMNVNNIKVAGYVLLSLCILGIGVYGWSSRGGEGGEAQEKFTVNTHDKTNFPLEGKHRSVPCSDCHLKGVMQGTPTQCEACHWGRKQDDRYQLQLGNHCADCHTPFDWKKIKPGSWEHGRVTGFKLEGIHGTLDCFQCHKGNSFATQAGGCFSCHEEEYSETRQPNHVSAGFPTDCRLCHRGMTHWEGAIYDHSIFPLQGMHRTASCTDCHVNGRYKTTPRECAGCHLEQYNGTSTPNHASAGYSTECQICHGTSANTWTGASIDHSKFPLNGKHRTAICTDCHKNGQYTGTSSACLGCHQSEYNNTRNPNHQQVGYTTDCERCHGTGATSWLNAVLDHSKFPLRGKHQTASCTDCHRNGQYTGTSQACVSCHRGDYDNTRNPNHQQAGYATDCERCHGSSATSWQGATSDHSRFPLRGKHQSAACTDCHKNGQYTGTSQLCYSCHQADYNGTTNPNHQQAAYSTECERCHGSNALSWSGATVDHSKFPLRGKHQTAACADCHKNGQYTGTSQLCYSCHQANYNATTNPNHQQAAYSTECERCHGNNALSWSGATVDHSKFPLRGRHQTAVCTDCHRNGQYTGLSQVCYNCHTTEYNNTTNPNHRLANFPTECIPCHGTAYNTWQGAVFNHSQFWQLQGPHVNLDCNKCHANGYNLPKDCYGCHRSNYENTRDPNHASAGFPTSCDSCHLPSHVSWNQAVFNHRFPIRSGRHSSLMCTDCHVTANYREFSCLTCHAHNQSDMDREHRGRSGYSYNSQACYSCHPDGRAD